MSEKFKPGDFVKQTYNLSKQENPYATVVEFLKNYYGPGEGTLRHVHKGSVDVYLSTPSDFIKVTAQEYYNEVSYGPRP